MSATFGKWLHMSIPGEAYFTIDSRRLRKLHAYFRRVTGTSPGHRGDAAMMSTHVYCIAKDREHAMAIACRLHDNGFEFEDIETLAPDDTGRFDVATAIPDAVIRRCERRMVAANVIMSIYAWDDEDEQRARDVLAQCRAPVVEAPKAPLVAHAHAGRW